MIKHSVRDGVFHPFDELPVFIISDFSVVHEEPDDRYVQRSLHVTVEDVLVGLAYVKSGTGNIFHSVGIDPRIFRAVLHTNQLPGLTTRTTGTEQKGHAYNGHSRDRNFPHPFNKSFADLGSLKKEA